MNQRLAAASLVSIFFALGQTGREAVGIVGMATTLFCQTAIDLSHAVKERKHR